MKTSLLTASFAALAAADLTKRLGIGNCMDGHEVREPKSGKIFALECGVSHYGGLIWPNASMPDASTLETCISACGRTERCILAEWNATSYLCGLKISYGVPRVVPGIIAARLEVKPSAPGTNYLIPSTNSSVPRGSSSVLWANSSAAQSTHASVAAPRPSGNAGVTNWVTQTFLQTVTQIRTVTVTPSSSLITGPVSTASQAPTVFVTVTAAHPNSMPSLSATSWANTTQNVSLSTIAGRPATSSTALQLSSSLLNANKPVLSLLLSSGNPATTLVTSTASFAPVSIAKPSTLFPAVSLAQPSSSALSVSAQPVYASNSVTLPASSGQPAVLPSVGKRGLLYTDAKYTKHFGGVGSKVTWASNWHSDRYMTPESVHVSEGLYNDALEFVPQLWSPAHGGFFDTQMTAEAQFKAGTLSVANVLAFNEPDQCGDKTGGSCMFDQTQLLVDTYRKHVQPHGKSMRLGSPSVTNGPQGRRWLKEFIDMCSDCQIDFVQAHFYGGGMKDFKDYLETFHKTFGKPIWLTEFGLDHANATPQKNLDFLKEALKYLDETSYVERYAYFMAAPSQTGLVNEDGSLTEIGKLYNSG